MVAKELADHALHLRPALNPLPSNCHTSFSRVVSKSGVCTATTHEILPAGKRADGTVGIVKAAQPFASQVLLIPVTAGDYGTQGNSVTLFLCHLIIHPIYQLHFMSPYSCTTFYPHPHFISHCKCTVFITFRLPGQTGKADIHTRTCPQSFFLF